MDEFAHCGKGWGGVVLFVWECLLWLELGRRYYSGRSLIFQMRRYKNKKKLIQKYFAETRRPFDLELAQTSTF